jgi:hypothetical protein
MSKDKVETDAGVQTALKALRSAEKTGSAFVVLGYSNPNTLTVLAEGEGGLNEASASFPDDDCRYVLLKKEHKVEISKTVKFAFVDWTPVGMKPMRKATISTHKGQVKEIMKPFHVDLVASDKSELSDDLILEKIGMSSGTSSFVTDKKATSLPRKEDPKQASYTPPTGKAGFTPMSQRLSKSGESEIKQPMKASVQQITFNDEASFKAALKAVRDDKQETNWVLGSYQGKNAVSFIGSGSGGVSELVTKLEDENINFGVIRVSENIDKSKTTKFVYIYWVPEAVKIMKKAEASARKGAIDAIFAPYHVDLTIQTKDELSDQIIMDKVSSASGSKSHIVQK